MEQEQGCSQVSSQGLPGRWAVPPTSIPLEGFLEEAVNLAEFSLIVPSIQEGFFEETQANG